MTRRRDLDYLSRLPETERQALRRQLLAWFRRYQRDMPWRRTRDPYRIWVSEVMLQQTQVPTVVGYYERFLAQFPTVEALAAAPEQAVLKVWQGLGYYRRARHLQAAARVVVERCGGRVPDDPEAFGRLPGVGRYTTGAVLSIAFGRRLAAMDGNAVRVLARWFAVTEPVTDVHVQRALWQVAEAMVPARAPGDWNQAVMELGSEVCTPRRPLCVTCPVGRRCLAAARGLQGRVPVRARRKAVPHIEVGLGIVWRRGRVLLCKRRADAMLGGLWEFPGGKREEGESVEACIRRELREECGLEVTVGESLVDVNHAYTHLRVTLRVYHCQAGAGRVRRLGCDNARWVRPEAIADYPLPAADVRILEALGVSASRAKAAARGRA